MNSKKQRRKGSAISVLLVLTLVLSILPARVLADDPQFEPNSVEETPADDITLPESEAEESSDAEEEMTSVEEEEIFASEEEEGFVPGAQTLIGDKWDIAVGDDTYTYEVTGVVINETGARTVSLCGFTDAGEITDHVEIPAFVQLGDEDYAVTGISENTFAGNEYLKSVILPDSLEIIGEEAFRNCIGITDVTIPATVATFGKYSFAGCTSLSNLSFAAGLKKIGVLSFFECTSLTSVDIPGSVTLIDTRAFDSCSNLESVKFEDGLRTIGIGAFQSCEKLQAVEIPDSVTALREYAFNKCRAMETLKIGNKITAIESTTFQLCESLITAEIPDGVTKIGAWAFYGCEKLKNLKLPDSVQSIGKLAFYGCAKLTSLKLPAQLTIVGESSFENCTGLFGTLTIPDTVTKVNNRAFYNCTSLTSLKLSESITDVGGRAFDGCTGLVGATLVLPASLEHAYNQSFGNRYFAKVINNSETELDHYSFLIPDEESEYFYFDSRDGKKAETLGKGTFILSDKELTIANIPCGKTLTYSGRTQTGVEAGDGYTLSGTASALNTGIYMAIASLKHGFVWSDGTTETKTILWKINKATIRVNVPAGKALAYSGKAQTGITTGAYYTLSGTTKAIKIGTYTAKASLKTDTNCTITWADGSTAVKTITWKIVKAANPLKVKAKTASVKYSKVKSKAQKLAVSKVMTFTKKGQGTISYALSSAKKGSKSFKKYFEVNKKTGAVTVKKGLKKGTYKVKINVKAAGSTNYKAATVGVTCTIKVS